VACKPNPVTTVGTHVGNHPILVFAHLFEEAAEVQSVEQAETHHLVVSGATVHIAEAEDFPFGAKCAQHFGGVYQRFNDVAALIRAIHRDCSDVSPLVT